MHIFVYIYIYRWISLPDGWIFLPANISTELHPCHPNPDLSISPQVQVKKVLKCRWTKKSAHAATLLGWRHDRERTTDSMVRTKIPQTTLQGGWEFPSLAALNFLLKPISTIFFTATISSIGELVVGKVGKRCFRSFDSCICFLECLYIYIYIYTHKYSYIYIYTYTHIHTHTHKRVFYPCILLMVKRNPQRSPAFFGIDVYKMFSRVDSGTKNYAL